MDHYLLRRSLGPVPQGGKHNGAYRGRGKRQACLLSDEKRTSKLRLRGLLMTQSGHAFSHAASDAAGTVFGNTPRSLLQ